MEKKLNSLKLSVYLLQRRLSMSTECLAYLVNEQLHLQLKSIEYKFHGFKYIKLYISFEDETLKFLVSQVDC